MTMRELAVGDVPVRALRVTFVGELGWELYCPSEYGLGLWQTLWEAGRPHGLVAGGYRAIDTMRLEKGYRVWAADITPDENPLEAGLGFCVKLDKEGGFIGRDALAAIRERGPSERRLLLPDPRRPALGGAGQRAGAVGDDVVGRVTSGGYGFSVERSIAYAWLPSEHAEPGTRGRRGHLRHLGRGRGRRRAAVRSRGEAGQRNGLIAMSSTTSSSRASSMREARNSLSSVAAAAGEPGPSAAMSLP